MKLQTHVPLQIADNQITYNSEVLLLGSCFVENIGKKLTYYNFLTYRNPFGILFNPKAIERVIVHALNGYVYTEKDIFFHQELWHCFDAHSDLSTTSKEELIAQLNLQLKKTKEYIEKSTHLIVTLGTAWVYKHTEQDRVVANCHKAPQKEFTKELLSVEEIGMSLKKLNDNIYKVNPSISLVYTVSPVRHLKDGFVENQRSKAHLLTAVHEVVSSFLFKKQYYFPSYEIMMDELRDYRFYGRDMVHPNEIAIDYIWEKFKEVWISIENSEIIKKVEEVKKGLNHRPFNKESQQHTAFLKSLEQKITYLKDRYPFMKFDK